MSLRNNCNHQEREAHDILDRVQAGIDVPDSVIAWALFCLGDGVGIVSIKEFGNA